MTMVQRSRDIEHLDTDLKKSEATYNTCLISDEALHSQVQTQAQVSSSFILICIRANRGLV